MRRTIFTHWTKNPKKNKTRKQRASPIGNKRESYSDYRKHPYIHTYIHKKLEKNYRGFDLLRERIIQSRLSNPREFGRYIGGVAVINTLRRHFGDANFREYVLAYLTYKNVNGEGRNRSDAEWVYLNKLTRLFDLLEKDPPYSEALEFWPCLHRPAPWSVH